MILRAPWCRKKLPPSDSQPLGITELHRPVGATEVDIVAVHGLNGDAIKTWTHDTDNVCWLRDLLPTYIPDARVLTWGYAANTHSLLGKPVSSDRILQHARTLSEELLSDRDHDDATKRPIIFVCHSLGGIIVKKALAFTSRQEVSESAGLYSIFICTFAVLFFGTPHSGSSKARILDRLQRLASVVIPKRIARFESGLVKALREGSETLQNITLEFEPLMSRFHILCLWEQLPTGIGRIKNYIVGIESAAPVIDGLDRCGIPADHRDMCRFQNAHSPGFRPVLDALKRYTQAAPMVIQRRLTETRVLKFMEELPADSLGFWQS